MGHASSKDYKQPLIEKNQSPKKSGKKTGMGLALYFGSCATLAFGGTGIEFYADHQQATTLAQDYGRAAQCEVKSTRSQCSEVELMSVARKQANESIREGGDDIQTLGTVGLVLGILF